jgi:hypothetical protein
VERHTCSSHLHIEFIIARGRGNYRTTRLTFDLHHAAISESRGEHEKKKPGIKRALPCISGDVQSDISNRSFGPSCHSHLPDITLSHPIRCHFRASDASECSRKGRTHQIQSPNVIDDDHPLNPGGQKVAAPVNLICCLIVRQSDARMSASASQSDSLNNGLRPKTDAISVPGMDVAVSRSRFNQKPFIDCDSTSCGD